MAEWNFDKVWEGLQEFGKSFEDRAAAVSDFMAAFSDNDLAGMGDAGYKWTKAWTWDSAMGLVKAGTGIPGIAHALEAYDWARAHALVRPATSLVMMGTRSDAYAPGAEWDYFLDTENWRRAWNDTQFVTLGQSLTWWGSFAFMDDAEAAKRDPGTFSGRQHYTGRHEAAIQASLHQVNMFDESGYADRMAFEDYAREVSRDPSAMDKYEANDWFKYTSGTLDFGAAFIDIPIIGWAAKATKSARLQKLGGMFETTGTPETAATFLGRSEDVLAGLDRAAAEQTGDVASKVRDAIIRSEAVQPGLIRADELTTEVADEVAAARDAVLRQEAQELATLAPNAQALYTLARDGNASRLQRIAVSNHAYGGMVASALTSLAKHRQPHNFADLYSALYGDELALSRVQANAPSFAVAIGRSQNAYNITTAARKFGVDEFATDIVRAQLDTQFNAHLDDIAKGEGAWQTQLGFGSQVNQPLIKVRAAAKLATNIHQWSIYQPPITYTMRRPSIAERVSAGVRKGARVLDRSAGYARDVNLNSHESYRDFRANLERADMSLEEINHWTSRYMAQATAAQRGQIVAHVEDMLYRRMGAKLGLSDQELSDVIGTVTNRRSAIQAQINQSRVYAPTELREMADKMAREGRQADAVRLREYAEAYEAGAKKGNLPAYWRKSIDHRGNVVIVGEDIERNVFDSDSVFLASQNADFLPMTDWRLMSDIGRRYIAPKKRIADAKVAREEGRRTGTFDVDAEKIALGDRVEIAKFQTGREFDRFLDVVNRTWATLAVMTPKHTFRAMANDFAMSAIAQGELRTFTGAWRGAFQGGRNLYARFQGAVEKRRQDKIRRQAQGDSFQLDIDETEPAVAVAQGAAKPSRGRGRPKAIDRFEAIDLPADIAAQTAGRYSYFESRQIAATRPLPFTQGNTTYYETLEEALSAGDLSTDQFLGAILADYKNGTLPVDYMQILDSIGADAKGRAEALDKVIDWALTKLGASAYQNPKFAIDIFDGLYREQTSRPAHRAAARAEIVADPLTGVWGRPKEELFKNFETIDYIDVKPDPDMFRLMTEEHRLKRAAEGAVAALPKVDNRPLERAQKRFEALHEQLQRQTEKAQLAEARISDRLAARDAARGAARRAGTSALANAKKTSTRAKARLAALEEAYDKQRALVDQLQADADKAARTAQETRAAELFHADRAALVDAYTSVDNLAYGYDFTAPEKLFRKHRGTFLEGNARMGFMLLPSGEIRVSVHTKAGEPVAPAKLTDKELPKIREYADKLLSTDNVGFRIKRGDQELRIQGAFYGDAGAAMRTAVAARAPQETWATDHMTKAADLAIAKVYARGGWKPNISPDMAEYPVAYERAVNLELGNDAVARKFMEGWTSDRVQRWLLQSSDGRKWLNNNTMGGAHYWEQVAAIGEFVATMLPTQKLRSLALSRKVTYGDLRAEVDAANLPNVHGEALANATGTSLVMQQVRKGIDGFFKWVVNKPSDHLIRFPFFARAYNDELRPLADAYLKQVKDGEFVNQAELDRLSEIARDRALRLTRNTLYETGFRTDAAEMFSKFMPFANAQADAIFKWARIAYQQPVRTLSVASRWWLMPERYGLISDQDGNQMVYEGGNSRWVDPVTLEDVTGKENVGKDRYVTMRLPSGLSPQMYNGRPAPLRFSKKSAELFLAWPTGGPWVSIPVNEFVLRTDPTLGDNEVVKALGLTYGPQSNVFKAALPGLLRSAYERFAGDDIDYASEAMDYFAQQQVDYAYGLRREPPSIEDAKEMASTMKQIRFWASGFAPVAVQFDNPYEHLTQYYRRLLAKHGGDKQLATDEFVKNVGQQAVALTYSVTRNAKGVPATKGAWEASTKMDDLISKFPQWTGVIVGNEGSSTFSKGIYEAQKRAGLRVPMTVEESAVEVSRREAWSRYDKFNKRLMVALNQRGLTDLNQRGAEDLLEYKRRWIDANKYWWGANGERELSPWYMDYNSRSADLEQRLIDAVQLVQDDRLQGRDEIRGLIDYLTLRRQYKAYLTGFGFGSMDVNAAASIRNSWLARLHDLKERNLSFQTLYDRYLETDNLAADLDYNAILGRS